MNKIRARYFYSPICTESFANISRLKSLFQKLSDEVDFECFNTTRISMDSDYPWFFAEQELLNTIQGVGNKLLSYNKLFIEGRHIAAGIRFDL